MVAPPVLMVTFAQFKGGLFFENGGPLGPDGHNYLPSSREGSLRMVAVMS